MFDDRFMSSLQRYQIASALSDDPNVQFQIQRDMFLSSIQEQEREEQMINRIADRVLQKFSISTDLQKAILEIKELKKALDSLCK